jgi:hypothetical protein
MSELDGKKTIEQLLAELEVARNKLSLDRAQSARDFKEAGELELKAANREKAAVQLYDGCARRLEDAMQMIRASAPPGTTWPEGSTQ